MTRARAHEDPRRRRRGAGARDRAGASRRTRPSTGSSPRRGTRASRATRRASRSRPTTSRDLLDARRARVVDLTVVGPEAPLVAGLADELEARGRRAFGPSREAAQDRGLEGVDEGRCASATGSRRPRSQAFTEVESRGRLPRTSRAAVRREGRRARRRQGRHRDRGPRGRRSTRRSARASRTACSAPPGSRVLIEEYLPGREVSAFAVTDGREIVPLGLAQDFKRVGRRRPGPNTGGHGRVLAGAVARRRHAASGSSTRSSPAAVRAMEAEGVRYRGVLYAGCMVTADGPKVLEFNARFGDPETQVVLPRLDSDLGELMLAMRRGEPVELPVTLAAGGVRDASSPPRAAIPGRTGRAWRSPGSRRPSRSPARSCSTPAPRSGRVEWSPRGGGCCR